jgi:hypothetical protein
VRRITPAILDLAAVSPDDAIIFCPANHNPPTRVAPYPGAPGLEGVATCLASPEVSAVQKALSRGVPTCREKRVWVRFGPSLRSGRVTARPS